MNRQEKAIRAALRSLAVDCNVASDAEVANGEAEKGCDHAAGHCERFDAVKTLFDALQEPKLRNKKGEVVLEPSKFGRWIVGEVFSSPPAAGDRIHVYEAYDVRAQADHHLQQIAKWHPAAKVYDREEGTTGVFFLHCPKCRLIPVHGICACSYREPAEIDSKGPRP